MDSKRLLKILKTKYSVAASIGGSNLLKTAIQARTDGADMIELRIDDICRSIKPSDIKTHIKKIRSRVKLPLIATIRPEKEQGMKNSCCPADKERLELFKSIIGLVDMIDIEISSESINREIVEMGHKKHKLVIISYHNFEKTPAMRLIKQQALKALRLKADIVKIAVMATKPEDPGKLLLFCRSWKKTPICAISMGRLGTISRIAGFAFGSCITYGYVDKTFAPGQLSIKELSVCSGIELSV